MLQEGNVVKVYTALGFPMYALHGTPAFTLLKVHWPSVTNNTFTSTSLIEMITLLNTQWLSEPSAQWLLFINCDWKGLLSQLLILLEDELLLESSHITLLLIKFLKFVILASRQIKSIFDAFLGTSDQLVVSIIKSYLKILTINGKSSLSIAEHILDLFCVYLSPLSYEIKKYDRLLTRSLVAYSKSSMFWEQSDNYRQLVKSFSNLLPEKIFVSPIQLQKTAFKVLHLATELTDKKLLSSLAFGEYPMLEKISSHLLKEIFIELGILQDFSDFPSSRFLAALLSCYIKDPSNKTTSNSFRSLQSFPTEKEIFAEEDSISYSFCTPLSPSNSSTMLYVPLLEEYSEDYFIRALLALRLDSGQEIRQELLDVTNRLSPAPPRWARMGCWLMPGSPSIMEQPGNRKVEEMNTAWVKLSIEVILPAPLDVIEEWDSLKKGELLFLIEIQPNKQLGSVRATEFQGFLASDGSIISGSSRKRRSANEKEGRRTLIILAESVSDSENLTRKFNAVVRRDPKTIPFKHRLKAISSSIYTSMAISPVIVNHFSQKASASFTQKTKFFVLLQSLYKPIIDLAISTINRPFLIVGSPGSGKTQVAAEIVAALYSGSINNYSESANNLPLEPKQVFDSNDSSSLPQGIRSKLLLTTKSENLSHLNGFSNATHPEKILLITNNNSTLDLLLGRVVSVLGSSSEECSANDLKSLTSMTPPSHIIRLGPADSIPTTALSAAGRLAIINQRRVDLLTMVDKLALLENNSIADHGATCESAECFYLNHLSAESKQDPSIQTLFSELRHLRPLEVLPSYSERLRFLIKHEARIIAATISQALRAIDGDGDLPSDYSTLIIDEASLLLDSEVVLLASYSIACKRIILIGDHFSLHPILHSTIIGEQVGAERSLFSNLLRIYEGGKNIPASLPPPLKPKSPSFPMVVIESHETSNTYSRFSKEPTNNLPNTVMSNCENEPILETSAMATFSHQNFCPSTSFQTSSVLVPSSSQSSPLEFTDSSLPLVVLSEQWRRPELSALFIWRYQFPPRENCKSSKRSFPPQNKGFSFLYQWVNVSDEDSHNSNSHYLKGRGKCEQEPIPNYFQNISEAEYTVAIFNYMVALEYEPSSISILTMYNGQKDLIMDILNRPKKNQKKPRDVSTVDQFQGLSNDFVILSMVRTRHIGHIRDLRRWIVAFSRARLGLYIVGKWSLFNTASMEGIVAYNTTLELLSQYPLQLSIQLEDKDILVSDSQQLQLLTSQFSIGDQNSDSSSDEEV